MSQNLPRDKNINLVVFQKLFVYFLPGWPKNNYETYGYSKDSKFTTRVTEPCRISKSLSTCRTNQSINTFTIQRLQINRFQYIDKLQRYIQFGLVRVFCSPFCKKQPAVLICLRKNITFGMLNFIFPNKFILNWTKTNKICWLGHCWDISSSPPSSCPPHRRRCPRSSDVPRPEAGRAAAGPSGTCCYTSSLETELLANWLVKKGHGYDKQ